MRWAHPLLFHRIVVSVTTALVAVSLLLSGPLGGNWVSDADAARNTPDGVRVAGEGWIQAQPDLVRINLGVDVVDPSLDTARTEAATRMQGVIDRLKATGIPESDIRTTSLDVTPLYDSSGQVREFRVRNVVEIRSHDVAGTSELIDGAVGAGATRVLGVSFDVENVASLKTQARDLALDDARAHAEKLAREAGVQLGPLLAIEEADFGGATPERSAPAPMPAASPASAPAAAPNPPTQPGTMQISTDMQMAWGRTLPPTTDAPGPPDRQEIDTVGRGIVVVSPDVATISLGVNVVNPSLPAAWEDAKARMRSIVQALVASGVAETDVRTTSITLDQVTDRDGNLVGYRVRNVVAVRSADVVGIGALVGRALAAGATQVLNIGFELADRSGPMDRARSLALENARGKAEQLAARAGVELGRPIAIGSSDTDGARPVRVGAGPLASRGGTPILPGAQDVRTSIRALWAIQ